MTNSVITIKAREKLAAARANKAPVAVIKGIALGNGAYIDGQVQPPNEADNALQNELIRKEYTSCNQLSSTSYRYRIDLSVDELADTDINEAALYDADGDLVAIQTFISKPKDNDMEMGFEFDDIF